MLLSLWSKSNLHTLHTIYTCVYKLVLIQLTRISCIAANHRSYCAFFPFSILYGIMILSIVTLVNVNIHVHTNGKLIQHISNSENQGKRDKYTVHIAFFRSSFSSSCNYNEKWTNMKIHFEITLNISSHQMKYAFHSCIFIRSLFR